MSPRTTRRDLFGASAAMLLLGASEASAAKASELDGELLRLVGELDVAHAKLDHNDGNPLLVSNQDFEVICSADLERYWEIASQIETLAARTPEGLQAKARAVRSVCRCLGDYEDGPLDRHVQSLLQNMLGEPSHGRALA